MKMEQSVPKRRHIKFRCRGIIQKKEYNNPNRRKLEIKSRILCNPAPNLNHRTAPLSKELLYPEYSKKYCLTLQQSTQKVYVTYTFIFQLLHVFALPDMFRRSRLNEFETLLNGNGTLPRTDIRHQTHA
jgi:hypothetical protein